MRVSKRTSEVYRVQEGCAVLHLVENCCFGEDFQSLTSSFFDTPS